VVWNVYAAPEFSLKPKTWWYPVVGSLKYRGYFFEQDARRYAKKLAGKGFDTYVDGVEAYSTLGWFKDPVLNTFIHHSESELADIIFHEFAHQCLFVRGDTDFNEAFANAVAQEGVRRWLLASGDFAPYEQYQITLKRNEQFVKLIQTTRRELESFYCNEKSQTPTNTPVSVADKRQSKEIIFVQLRRNYEELKKQWDGFAGYDNWFTQSLNNAQLNTVATYYDLVPAFQHLLQQSAGDLNEFYREVRIVSKLPKVERHRKLFSQETNP
jgi:predicted aminopeptidase